MPNVERISERERINQLLEKALEGENNSNESNDDRGERKDIRKPSTSKKVGRFILSTIGVSVAVGLVGTGFVAYGIANGLGPHIETHAGVAKGGHGTIEKVSTEMPPITLATADTKVTGEKVAFKQDFKAFGLSIPFNQQTVTRDAMVETLIVLNPESSNIDISYDSSKEKVTYTLPDNTLSTKVDIPTGKGKTSETSGSITTFGSDVSSAMANAISGMFGNDASSVPLLGEVAQGKTSVSNALTSFADLAITTGVDQQCTPLIETIPHFTDQLKDNVRTVMNGSIMTSKDVQEKLPDLMNKPLKEVQKILDKATVEMPTDYKIGPDQTAKASFDKYIKSKFFSTDAKDVPPIKCGVSESAKLSLVDDKKE